MKKEISFEEYQRGALKVVKKLMESKRELQEEIRNDAKTPEFQRALKILRTKNGESRNKIIRL